MKTVSSPSHDLVKHWVRLNKERSYRQSSQRVLVEGKNLLLDLVVRHRPLQMVLTEENRGLFAGFDEVVISDAVAKKISSVESPEGVFAEFVLPVPSPYRTADHVVIFDRLQDPGNLGTLFRTCLAFNLSTVFLIEPCCDPWNPKAVRAAKGAQFDLAIHSSSWEDLPYTGPLLVADASGQDVQTIARPKSWALVLGNEAHGPSVPPTRLSTPVCIPMSGPVESLNVAQAGAILLYSLLNSD